MLARYRREMRIPLAVVVSLGFVAPIAEAWAGECYQSRGQVVIKTPTLNGSGDQLEPATVKRYIRRHRDKLEYCYQKQLFATPEMQAGVVATTFRILPNGTVRDVHADGFDDQVDACIAGVIGSIELPRPGSEIVAAIALDFSGGPELFAVDADCETVPTKLRTLASKLARSIDGDDTKAFLRLLPSKIEVLGKKRNKPKVEAAIAADGFATWHGLFAGGWVLVPHGKKEYALYRDSRVGHTRGEDEEMRAIVLRKSGKAWKVRGLVSIPRPLRGF